MSDEYVRVCLRLRREDVVLIDALAHEAKIPREGMLRWMVLKVLRPNLAVKDEE